MMETLHICKVTYQVIPLSVAAMLPGPVIPILNQVFFLFHLLAHGGVVELMPPNVWQTFLVWQLLFALLILGRRFLLNQIAGCLLVAVGVVVAVSRYPFTLLFFQLSWPREMCVYP